MDNNSYCALILEITKVSFVLDELRLFLDTHPEDAKALAEYNKHAKHRQALVDEYTCSYGPLTFYDLNDGDCWMWNNAPMPWQ